MARRLPPQTWWSPRAGCVLHRRDCRPRRAELLVPYPFATADHQTTNARYLVDAGAAVLVADDDIDAPTFSEQLVSLVDEPARRGAMRAAAQGLGQDRAATALADQVESVAATRD